MQNVILSKHRISIDARGLNEQIGANWPLGQSFYLPSTHSIRQDYAMTCDVSVQLYSLRGNKRFVSALRLNLILCELWPVDTIILNYYIFLPCPTNSEESEKALYGLKWNDENSKIVTSETFNSITEGMQKQTENIMKNLLFVCMEVRYRMPSYSYTYC